MKRCFIGIVLALTATVARSQDAWRITAENPLEGVYYGETVANGILGLRSSRMPLVNDGVILAGTYDRHPVENIDCHFDNIRMMNLALSFDGAKVDTADITDYTQTLVIHRHST